jgi:hypothetical protein
MSEHNTVPNSDICLLLRAHAERGWLSREVLPVLIQLETPDALPSEQVAAALAYLEVSWMRAQLLAWESDSTRARLQGDGAADPLLGGRARRYHAAVCLARNALSGRVSSLLSRALSEDPPLPIWRASGAHARVGASPAQPS